MGLCPGLRALVGIWGIVFAIIFRYGSGYATSIWIIGAIVIGVNVAVSWIKPIPRGQIGGGREVEVETLESWKGLVSLVYCDSTVQRYHFRIRRF